MDKIEGESQSMEFGPYEVPIVNGFSPSLSQKPKSPKSRNGSVVLSGTVTVLNGSYLPNSHQNPGPSSLSLIHSPFLPPSRAARRPGCASFSLAFHCFVVNNVGVNLTAGKCNKRHFTLKLAHCCILNLEIVVEPRENFTVAVFFPRLVTFCFKCK
ncbi:hypothetical protein SLE2022_070740 [Rubroshorea leprosula]